MEPTRGGTVYFDPEKQQFYTQSQTYPMFPQIKPRRTYLDNLITSSQQQPSNYGQPVQYTPNPVTAAQLQGMNNMTSPQWMMDAYSRKIGQMGGNANSPVPFGVNQSGFPGIGGKTAPTQG